jgi:hypothetical protein
MTKRLSTFIYLLIILIISFSIFVASKTLPLTNEEEVAIRILKSEENILLLPGDTVKQKFEPVANKLSGVVFFANIKHLQDRQFTVRILNDNHQELTSSTKLKTSYAPGEMMKLSFHLSTIPITTSENLFVEFTLKEGPPIGLFTTDQKVYKQGELSHNDETADYDLVLNTLKPGEISFGAKQGVLVALIFTISYAALNLLPKRYRWPATIILFILITPLAILGFWFSSGSLGIADWDLYFPYHHYLRRTLLEFKQFPLWNPWTCGGTAALADPEFPIFTPTFLVETVFGIPAGFRLAIFLSIATTAVGTLLLCKRLSLSLAGSIIAALGVSFGSVTILELVEGHPNVLSAMWIPWIFWAWFGAYRDRVFGRDPTKNTLAVGIFLALTFFQGGIYLLSYTGLVFLMMILLAKKSRLALKTTIIGTVLALGITAIKLVPTLLWLRRYPDESYASSTYTLPWLKDILLGRHLHGTDIIFEQTSGWHEYGAYIGIGVAILAIIGAVTGRKKRIVQGLIIGTIITILLSSTGPALKNTFDQIPFIPRSNISRIIIFTVMSLSLLAGFAIDYLKKIFRSKIIITLIILAVSLELISLSYPLSQQAFVLPDVYPIVEPAPSPIAYTTNRYDQQGQETRTTRTYAAAKAGYGVFAYCTVLGPSAAVRTIHEEGDNKAFNIVPKKELKNATLQYWSPNKVIINTNSSEEIEVFLNTNYAKGWYANNKPTKEEAGLVSARLPVNTNRVVFTYRPPGLYIGIFITLITIISITYILDNQRRRK